jgi:predicted MFS family arabinose efflux permease
MAAGGWIAGMLYDHLGYYAPAFATGIGANLLNLLLVSVFVARRKGRGPGARAAASLSGVGAKE